MHAEHLVDDVGEEGLGALVQVVALENVAAVAVDGLALTVENVIVLEHVLADLGVSALDLRLGAANGAADNLGFDRHIVWHTLAAHEGLRGAGVEQAHEVVGE